MNKEAVYIAGKITGDPEYKAKFKAAREALEAAGFVVLDPSVLPFPGLRYDAYIKIGAAMLDECAAVCFLSDWVDSNGAMYEYGRATAQEKRVFFYEDWKMERERRMPKEGCADAKAE